MRGQGKVYTLLEWHQLLQNNPRVSVLINYSTEGGFVSLGRRWLQMNCLSLNIQEEKAEVTSFCTHTLVNICSHLDQRVVFIFWIWPWGKGFAISCRSEAHDCGCQWYTLWCWSTLCRVTSCLFSPYIHLWLPQSLTFVQVSPVTDT